MTHVIDDYAEPFVSLWNEFCDNEGIVRGEPVAIDDDPHWEPKGPTGTLDDLWATQTSGRDLGFHREEILARVRSWLRGAEQSAIEDRIQVEELFERCTSQPELHGWAELRGSAREGVLDQLLAVVGSLSATIANDRPVTNDEVLFRIDWQQDGDGQGLWELPTDRRGHSLAAAIDDLAQLHARFDAHARPALTRQMLQDLRTGALNLPLFERARESSKHTTWLREIEPGNTADEGLLLPERAPAIDDESILWQQSPRLASVYEEALIAAAKADVEPYLRDWSSVEFQEAPQDVVETSQIAKLCKMFATYTPLNASQAGAFLALPLYVISATATNPSLQRRARSVLASLRNLCLSHL